MEGVSSLVIHLLAWVSLAGMIYLAMESLHDKLDVILRELRKGK